ncbi:oligosaccharide flippase family protein [Candidatus Gottesmanbacteria bacterium]|nr:oligosaccharide flippase family protein [Candidatus Gottesmanbacteria bacterium]
MFEKIKEIIFKVLENRVVSGSLVMVIGGFLISLTNYFYHLITARTLGPRDYGTLDSLVSLLTQISIPLAVVSMVIIRYVSSFKGQARTKTIESFFWKINKRLLFLTPPLLILVFLVTPLVTNFLHLSSPFLFLWIGLSFVFGIFISVGKSFIQGLCRFLPLTIVGIAEGIFRLLLTIILIAWGWGLFGAIVPFFAMTVLSLVLTLILVRDLLFGERNEPIPEKKEIFTFTLPVFFNNIGVTSLITTDVILARHFLSATDAGFYAALSTLSKIIYFAAVPVVGVIFPLISEAQAAKENVKKIIFPGLLIIGLIVGSALIVFGFFPKLMILLLFGEKYFFIEPFIIYFALAMSFYTFDVAFLNIFLAQKMATPIFFVCLAALLQIILITLFHQSIGQIVNIFVFISSLLFALLLLYYFRSEKS